MDIRDMAAGLGRRGGLARAKRLSAAERTRIASMGARARLLSLEAERRVASNFQYAAVVRELAGRQRQVQRMSAFKGPLPGLYPGEQ